MIFPLGIILSFFVGTMFQGLSFGISGLEEIGYRFAFIMPFIVIAFYILGKKLAKPKN